MWSPEMSRHSRAASGRDVTMRNGPPKPKVQTDNREEGWEAIRRQSNVHLHFSALGAKKYPFQPGLLTTLRKRRKY